MISMQFFNIINFAIFLFYYQNFYLDYDFSKPLTLYLPHSICKLWLLLHGYGCFHLFHPFRYFLRHLLLDGPWLHQAAIQHNRNNILSI